MPTYIFEPFMEPWINALPLIDQKLNIIHDLIFIGPLDGYRVPACQEIGEHNHERNGRISSQIFIQVNIYLINGRRTGTMHVHKGSSPNYDQSCNFIGFL